MPPTITTLETFIRPQPNVSYLFSIPFIPIASYGNVAPTKIYTNNIGCFDWLRSFIFDLNMNVVGTILMLAQLRRRGFFASVVNILIDSMNFSSLCYD
ncbi:MAG: hypothetical protein V7K41_28135 [Nostoc sp.]|uniref:hypothetical protein n=1 Tax=Nostoc sp. TaxID=1180 RepID=UPI002FF5958A